MKISKIKQLQILCQDNFIEYTIDGGSKHPNICVHLWKTYNSSFNIYGISAELDSAIDSAMKQFKLKSEVSV
jgi:hypothetical protein